ncbi:unnamed protein product [Phaeothamnion confervicola]
MGLLNIHAMKADISDAVDREALLTKAGDLFDGKLDILVNNVGTNIRKSTVDYSEEEFQQARKEQFFEFIPLFRVMSVNFNGFYLLTRAAHALLKASGDASVVNVSSVAGLIAIKSGSPYAASKAAMNHTTAYLGCEWAPDGVRVNAVAPWYTRTPLAAPVFEDEEKLAEIVNRTPMGRTAEPEEVSGVVAFLCMPGASYITGEVVSIDGGFTKNGWMT